MSRNFSKPTIRKLYGRATHCAYQPDCDNELIFEDRGCLTVSCDIAHIRSDSPNGPRYVPGYAPVNEEENLLLLCGKHHRPVDQHDSEYSIDELLEWKRVQVSTGSDRQFSAEQLDQIVQQVVGSLAATLTEVKLTVHPVGLVHIGQGWLTVPLSSLAATTSDAPQTQYLGVNVVNEGLVAVTIGGVGIDLDTNAPSHLSYHFPLEDSPLFPSRRIEGRSSAAYPAHIPTVQAGIANIAQSHTQIPYRFRAFVKHGADHREEGGWMSALDLPIWKEGMTEARLQGWIRR